MVNRLHSAWRTVALGAGALIGVMVGLSGSGGGIEHALQSAAFDLRHHSGSGHLHLVEIDERSVNAIDRWPWPRENYAKLVDRLREAGAASIAFDVDFSSRGTPAGDSAFAAALARANGAVILPTLRQESGAAAHTYIDALPTPLLRAHAMAAAVSIRPDCDGTVRRAPMGIVTAGVPRPSLSAMLAGRSATAGIDFPIDFSIDPASIPRHSFIDIRDGRFDPRAIAGKQILIGATAVELGDRYAIPASGVVAGVVIQALATETLAHGVPREIGWFPALVLALAGAALLLRAQSRFALGLGAVAGPIAAFGLLLLGQMLGATLLVAPALAALALVSVVAIARRVRWVLHERLTHDSATGLPNRAALLETTADQGDLIVAAARIVDYDKLVAGLGAAAAAKLVCSIADRIALVGGRVYRSEDRVLAWQAPADMELVAAAYEQLRALMLSPVEVGGRRVDVSLALGIAQGSGREAERTVAHATLAADQAIASREGWHVHAASEQEDVERELSLMGELDDAIERGEIEIAYQPKLALAGRRITSVEALVRWNHPTRGYLRPDLFIPLAERNDHIAALTLHVLERTIADLARWAAAGTEIDAAVNISAKLLKSAPFSAALRDILSTTAVNPERLIFEVTESAAMDDPAAAIAALNSFKALGVAISMDDYGTGQSTLTYLKRLPLDELKIDRSFVQHVHQNRSDAVLVRSTIDLAHELGLKVVAEGVEDQACLDFLAAARCDYAQGYLISRPVSAEAIQALLAREVALAA